MEEQGSAFVAIDADEKMREQFNRRSYMPSWMADPSWMKSVELPQEYMMELISNGRTGSMGSPRSAPSHASANMFGKRASLRLEETARQTMSCWAGSERNSNAESAQERLMSLLADAVKALTQRTPWDPAECGTERRKAMLGVLIKRFLDQSLDPGAVGIFARDILRRGSETDVAQELQFLYVAFTHDKTWNGEDPYRRPENFMHRADYDRFRESCLEEVRRRLHMLNGDLSGKNMNETHAKKIWENIHGDQRGECFGGSITLTLSEVKLCALEDSRRPDEGGGVTKRKKIPKYVKAIWSLQQRGHDVCSVAVPVKGVLQNGKYVWKHDGRATLIVPKGSCNNFKHFSILLELLMPQQGCFCSAPREKFLASAAITVDDALYVNVAEPNSPLRTSTKKFSPNVNREVVNNDANEPFLSPNVGIIGYHFSSVLLSPNVVSSGRKEYPYVLQAAKALCSMCCLNEEHNTRPPAVNLEEKDIVASLPNMETTSSLQDGWSKDYHQSFLRLVDVLGEMDDIGVAIIKTYCRRYLIHGELETVALLASVCTRCNLADMTSRSLCKDALLSLLDLRGNVTTHVTEYLVAEAIETTRGHILDIILSLEDISVSSPPINTNTNSASASSLPLAPRQAAIVLEEMEKLLLIIDENIKVSAVILKEAEREAKCIVDALERLDGRVLREHRREEVRETMTNLSLPELERQEDGARLTGKARYLLELLTHTTERCKRAFSFAQASQSLSVMDIALCRIETITGAISGPLRNIVTRMLACLVRTSESDPLGDTLGLLVSTYGSVMSLIDILDADPKTASICSELAGCFKDFMSSWFPLCENHISIWISSIVTNEPLEALLKGAIYCNQSPALLQDLLQALLSVFLRILAWTNPQQHAMYAVHFFTFVQRLGESFVDAVVVLGRTTSRLEEWLVCLSVLRRYQTIMREFGDKDVHTQLIKILQDPGCLMEHQRRVIAEQTRANTMEAEDHFVEHIAYSLEQSLLSFLSDLTDVKYLKKSYNSTSIMQDAFDRLGNYIEEELRTARDNLSDELFVTFLNEIAIRAYYGAFRSLLLRECKAPISESHVAFLLHLLQTLDCKMELVGGDKLQLEPLNSRKRNGCILTTLLGQSSQTLVQMASLSDLDSAERVHVELILHSRRDSVAKHYVMMSSEK